jgi:hypothetical protein
MCRLICLSAKYLLINLVFLHLRQMNNGKLNLEWVPAAYARDKSVHGNYSSKRKINLKLTADEKLLLKQKGITQKALMDYAIDEIIATLNPSPQRAKILQALYEFQQLPSIGIRFAHDLIYLGYYSLAELKGMQGAELLDSYERKLGSKVDPCVEDQFRLIVYYASNLNSKKQWWDFTAERKAYRAKYGYPATRP